MQKCKRETSKTKNVNPEGVRGRRTRGEAARLFSELGISTTQVINMFLKQAAREQQIPFEIVARPAAEQRRR